MDLGLIGKVVLVTGGSGGIGAPTALAFAAEGASVAVTYHQHDAAAEEVVRSIEASSGRAVAVRLDLREPESIYRAVDAVTARLGPPSVCVCCASPAEGPDTRRPARFENIPVDAWHDDLRAEVDGAFHTARAVIPAMREHGWGRLIFLSASLVSRGFAGQEAYVAGKSAVHGLSRTLATELYANGILSNVVAPGPTITGKMMAKVPAGIRRKVAGQSPEELRRSLSIHMPHLRFSTPEDIVNVILFLASPANGNINGSVITVAGGI